MERTKLNRHTFIIALCVMIIVMLMLMVSIMFMVMAIMMKIIATVTGGAQHFCFGGSMVSIRALRF